MATIIQHPAYDFKEADIKHLIRNALMVAGQEMGSEGDHWPVIKNTVTDVMRDWEELEIERTVSEELRKQMNHYLDEMTEVLKTCKPEVQNAAAPYIKELRSLYDSAFAPIQDNIIDFTPHDETAPLHVKRAQAIIDTLFDDSVMEESYA